MSRGLHLLSYIQAANLNLLSIIQMSILMDLQGGQPAVAGYKQNIMFDSQN